MSNRTRRTKAVATKDSFANVSAGLGVTTNNLLSHGGYNKNSITRNRLELENAYRGSFIVGLAVDLVSEDMTKKGIKINSTLTPVEIDTVQEALLDMDIWNSLCDCIKWSRLYGGSLGYLLIDGQDASTELDLNSISVGQFKGIYTLDRWQVTPSSELVTEFGLNYSLPMYYTLQVSGGVTAPKIHHSRILRFTGIDLPFQQKITEDSWGESVVERMWDRLIAFDSTTVGAAQLVFKAHLRTLKVKGLRQALSSGGVALKGVLDMASHLKSQQSNEGLALIDDTDSMENTQYSFSGLSDVINTFLEQISAATEIPLQRLLGQASSGFGNGEDNLKNYASNINRKQNNKLRKPIKLLLELLSRSVLGKELPIGTTFVFNNLLDLNEKEEAEKLKLQTDIIINAKNAELITIEEARKELLQLEGSFTNIQSTN